MPGLPDQFRLNGNTAKTSVALQLSGNAVAAIVLTARESISLPQAGLTVLWLLAILIAVIFRISTSAFALWSILFPAPIILLEFADTEVRLFHLLAISVIVHASWQMATGRRPGLGKFEIVPILFIVSLAFFGLIPQGLAGADNLGSLLRFHLEILLAYAVGYITFCRINQEEIISLSRQLGVALATVYLYWLGTVSVAPENWFEAIDVNRPSHFIFPMVGGHLGTGVFLMTLIFLVYSRPRNLAASRIDQILTFLFSAAIGASSSRGATIVLLIVALGLTISAILSRKRQDWMAPLFVSAGLAFSTLELARQGRPERHTIVDDFRTMPILTDTRIGLAFDAFGRIQEIWQSSNILEILFGIGYNSTLKRYGVDLDAHNDFLNTFLERGFLGFALVCIAMYFFTRKTLQVFRHQPPMLLALWASVLAMGTFGLTGMASPIFLVLGGVFASRTPKGRHWRFQDGGIKSVGEGA